MNYLAVDFGSTYTKLTAISDSQSAILGTAIAFTTITTNIMDGFEIARQKLEKQIGKITFQQTLCCSSAGGGLKMIALGLVPELTAKAARMAATSAGAKVVKTYSFEISKAEQKEIYEIDPDLVLLCGGTDGGNKEVILANAKRLCEIKRDFSIIAAGNKVASYELEEIFKNSGKNYVITTNVMPTFNHLDTEPAKASIRSLFIEKIIEAKGLSKVQQMASVEVIPTPLAVMSACELLSKGTKGEEGIGEFLAIDLGGATTDVYSMAKGDPTLSNVIVKGLPEAFNKRTVEGDLGMRYSLESLVSESEMEDIATKTGLSLEAVDEWISHCIEAPATTAIPNTDGSKIEEQLAKIAVKKAVDRHCGHMESAYTPVGEVFVLEGKDLTEIPYIIGIGGAIINSDQPGSVLQAAVYNARDFKHMKPKQPNFLLDKKYILAAMGLLSLINPSLALKLMKQEIQEI